MCRPLALRDRILLPLNRSEQCLVAGAGPLFGSRVLLVLRHPPPALDLLADRIEALEMAEYAIEEMDPDEGDEDEPPLGV